MTWILKSLPWLYCSQWNVFICLKVLRCIIFGKILRAEARSHQNLMLLLNTFSIHINVNLWPFSTWILKSLPWLYCSQWNVFICLKIFRCIIFGKILRAEARSHQNLILFLNTFSIHVNVNFSPFLTWILKSLPWVYFCQWNVFIF